MTCQKGSHENLVDKVIQTLGFLFQILPSYLCCCNFLNVQMQVEGYQVVYSTLAGDQYDKVIVPRNGGATTKTNLTGKCRGKHVFLLPYISAVKLY